MIKKVLFVCTGNTCRSPMAEAVAKKIIKNRKLSNLKVESAGISVMPGDAISKNAKDALKLIGITCNHKARQFDLDMIKQYGLILTMTKMQKEAIGNFENILTIEEYTNRPEISDPYGQNLMAYIETCEEIEKAVSIMIEKITLEVEDVIFWLYQN